MINAGDFIYIESRVDLECHIKIQNGILKINGGLIRNENKPKEYPAIMKYNGFQWLEDSSCKDIIIEYLENRIKKIQDDIKKVEKVK